MKNLMRAQSAKICVLVVMLLLVSSLTSAVTSSAQEAVSNDSSSAGNESVKSVSGSESISSSQNPGPQPTVKPLPTADAGGSVSGSGSRYRGSNRPPEIVLNGAQSFTQFVNDRYHESGALVMDPEEGDITSRMTISGSVNPNQVGNYKVFYIVSDSEGLTDTEVRLINVIARPSEDGDQNDDNNNHRGGGGGRRNSPEGRVLGLETGPQCSYISTHMSQGEKNDSVEVYKLQYFLKSIQGFDGVVINGVYDDATANAVSAFQTRYAKDILEPWGYTSSEPTGFLYILTKNKINELVCGTSQPLSVDEQSEISSFRASRLFGLAVR